MRQKRIGLRGRGWPALCCLPNLTNDSRSGNCRQRHDVDIFVVTGAVSLRLDCYQPKTNTFSVPLQLEKQKGAFFSFPNIPFHGYFYMFGLKSDVLFCFNFCFKFHFWLQCNACASSKLWYISMSLN